MIKGSPIQGVFSIFQFSNLLLNRKSQYKITANFSFRRLNMKKWLGILILIIVAAWIVIYQNSQKDIKTDSKPVIKIGVILPLTGNNSVIGSQMKDGINFVRTNLAPDVDYEVIFEDDQLNPTKTINAANKLINLDKVDAILTGSSVQAQVVAPLAEKHNVLQIAISSDTRFTKYKNNYALAPSTPQEVNVLLSEIAKRGYKKAALISSDEVYSNLTIKEIEKKINDYGLEIVYNKKFSAPVRDFKMMIADSQNKKPDIYILQTWMPEIDILAKQLREQNKNIPMTALYAFFLSRNPQLYEGQFAVNIGVTNPEFSQQFYQKYNAYPEQMSALAYLMLQLGLEKLKSPDKDPKKIFEKADSVVGKLTLEDKAIRFAPVVQEFKNGKPVLVE